MALPLALGALRQATSGRLFIAFNNGWVIFIPVLMVVYVTFDSVVVEKVGIRMAGSVLNWVDGEGQRFGRSGALAWGRLALPLSPSRTGEDMYEAEVEFFTEDIDGVEYLNVGLQWEGRNGETVRCVLGAFTDEPDENAMIVIKGLVETAAAFILEDERANKLVVAASNMGAAGLDAKP